MHQVQINPSPPGAIHLLIIYTVTEKFTMRQFEMLIKLLWPISLTALNQTLLACCESITWLRVGQQ